MTRIVLHRAQLGGDAERVGDSLGRAFVVGREGDPDMAIVEYGVVGSVRLLDLDSMIGQSGSS